MRIMSVKLFLVMAIFAFISILIGCSTLTVTVDKEVPKIQRDEKIAYFKNLFCLRTFTKGTISSIVYRNRSSENVDKFQEVEKIAGDHIAVFCANNIKQKTGNEVVIIEPGFSINDFDIFDNDSKELEDKIISELQKVKADYAFIPVMRVRVRKTWGMGESGNNYFESKIYICNKEGKVIGEGYIATKEEWIDPVDTTMYQILIKSSEPLYEEVIGRIF